MNSAIPDSAPASSQSIAYPLDEFYARSGLNLPPLDQIDGEAMPEPYKSLLVHERDMTSTLESFHKAGIHLRLVSRRQRGDEYFREVVLAGGSEELAIPQSAVVRDGARAIIFRRDPANPDKAIRMEADLGLSDGRWVVIASGVKEGDEIVMGGNFQLMLATSGETSKGGHFHADGTFHDGEDK